MWTLKAAFCLLIIFVQSVNAHIDPHSKQFWSLTDQEMDYNYEKGFVGEFFLQPGFVLKEQSYFQLSGSSIYLSAGKSYYSAHVLFAENRSFLQNLLPNPHTRKLDYSITSIFVQADWPSYGRLRLGLIPLAYGLEGGVRDAQLRLPRSIFSQFIPHYDLGLSYLISHNGFYVESALHNGAFQTKSLSSPLASHLLWWTTKGGWKGAYGLDLGLSATVGEFVNPGIGPYISHARRLGNIYLGFGIESFSLRTEFHFGEIWLDENQIPVSVWRLDIEHPLTRGSSLFARYESLHIDNNIGLIDVQKKLTLGVALKYKQNTFSIFYERPFISTKFYQPQLVFLYQLLLRKIDNKLLGL